MSYRKIWNELFTGKTDSASDFYYAKMGVAWALATAMAKFPQKTLAFFKSSSVKIDSWTYNKAIQKMCESYRVSDKIKALVRKLKRV